MISNERVTLRATVFWGKFEKKDEMSGKYQVVLGNLSESAVAKLNELGIRVKDTEAMGSCITTKSNWPIVPVDVDGNSFADKTQMIGNGTIVRASLKPFAYSVGANSGVTTLPQRIVVEDLVTYAEGGDFDEGEVL